MPLTRAFLALSCAAVALAADPLPAVRVPLEVLGVQVGESVTVDGVASPVEATGLALVPHRTASVTWRQRGRDVTYPLTVVMAGGADQRPAWHADAPRTEGDQVIAVGTGSSTTVSRAQERALLMARQTAATAAAGTTTTTTTNTPPGPDGQGAVRNQHTRTSTNAQMSSTTRALVILIDPTATPPVSCWAQVAGRVTALAEKPEQRAAREKLEQALKALDAKLEADLAQPAPPTETPPASPPAPAAP